MDAGWWADVAQIIGAFALVVSLGFVGFELSNNNKLVKIQQRSDRISALKEYKAIGTDPVFCKLLERARTDYGSLEQHEKLAFEHYMEIAIPSIMGLKLFSDMSSVGAANAID